MGWPALAASSAGLYWNCSIVIALPACAWAVDSPPGVTPTAVNDRPRATTRPAMSIVNFRMVPRYPGPKCPERAGSGSSTDGGEGTPKGARRVSVCQATTSARAPGSDGEYDLSAAPAPEVPMAEFPAITHVALTVTDLDRTVPRYQALFGSKPVLDEDTGPFHHVV